MKPFKRKIISAFTLIEVMIASFIFVLLVAGVVWTAARFFDRQTEIREMSKRFEAFTSARSEITELLRTAYFVQDVSSSVYGINSRVDATTKLQSLLVYSTGHWLFQAWSSGSFTPYDPVGVASVRIQSCDTTTQTCQISMTDSQNRALPLQNKSWLLLSRLGNSQLVQIEQVKTHTFPAADYVVAPLISTNLQMNNFDSIVAFPAKPSLIAEIKDGTKNCLKWYESDQIPNPDRCQDTQTPVASRVLVKETSNFAVQYLLRNKSAQNFKDPCVAPMSLTTDFTSTQCTPNNIAMVDVSLTYQKGHWRDSDVLTGLSEVETFRVSPVNYNTTLDLAASSSGDAPPVNCQDLQPDKNPNDRCNPWCSYPTNTSTNYNYGSSYCNCVLNAECATPSPAPKSSGGPSGGKPPGPPSGPVLPPETGQEGGF